MIFARKRASDVPPDVDIARLKPVGALVQLKRVDLGQYPAQLGDRIVGIVGIGNMALHAVYRDPHIYRPAPANLHHVAELVD